jgi:hypothetical protein
MLLGVDFDNTIVCYDQIFHRVARERGLVPENVPVNKGAVRDYLRQVGREQDWTELQGYVYGPRLCDAEPFPGVLDYFRHAVRAGAAVCIISHKTRHPYLGPQYDLHESAWGWLEQHGFFSADEIGLPRDHVYLELTKFAKLDRIARVGCTHFIDDLPELLAEPGFPTGVARVHFDPAEVHADSRQFVRMTDWREAARSLNVANGAATHRALEEAGA